jgi:triosephosphate isomerase
MRRKFLIAGNWKMNNGISDAVSLVGTVKNRIKNVHSVDVLVCPPFIALDAVCRSVVDSLLRVGAQNMHFEAKGAFTGEVSFSMLRDCRVSHVILGHSERRAMFGEDDALINKKVCAALGNNLSPILCVGETEKERESDKTFAVIDGQLSNCLDGVLNGQVGNLAIAYEPVWAIGTGKTATPEIAQEVHAFIREKLTKLFGKKPANSVRILYGGSMKADNAKKLLDQEDIDGGLIGGASLLANEFCSIVEAAESLSS